MLSPTKVAVGSPSPIFDQFMAAGPGGSPRWRRSISIPEAGSGELGGMNIYSPAISGVNIPFWHPGFWDS